MLILGIETSCDETAVALYDAKRGLLAHEIHRQTAMHNEYGGVVPELASRDHIRRCLPLIKKALKTARKQVKDIHGIAYTKGPGLVGALFVGAAIGRSLGWALDVPTIGVHHMEAHLLAPMLEKKAPKFPFIALLVSGGHTLLIQVTDVGEYRLLGESLDDACGEAFDKTARLLGLPYPGGPVIETLAKQGNPQRFHFPRPMTDRSGLDFSFSGLKTAVVNTMHIEGWEEQTKADLAAAFQDAVIDTLIIKCRRALEQTQLNTLVIAGGVSANQLLRERMQTMAKDLKANVFYPRAEFCTDNGAMVAYAGYQRLLKGQKDDLEIEVLPRWSLTNVCHASQGARSAPRGGIL